MKGKDRRRFFSKRVSINPQSSTIFPVLTTYNRIDFETMVIADPYTVTPLTTGETDLRGFSVGDCLTDTLTSK